MRIIKNPTEWIRPDKSIGFVPTMGALHQGHRSLIDRSLRENDHTVVSIFVNPTQFNKKQDLACYPKTLDADIRMAKGIDTLFVPDNLYPDNYTYRVTETEISKRLEGVSRPGHFDGMLTVVLKLLMIFLPTKAYFGKKDYQQYQLVKGMQEAFYLPCEIVGCDTIREPSGIAMSSRNRQLSAAGLEQGALFSKLLREGADLQQAGFSVEYVEEWKNRRFGAVSIEGVRLIDNVEIGCG